MVKYFTDPNATQPPDMQLLFPFVETALPLAYGVLGVQLFHVTNSICFLDWLTYLPLLYCCAWYYDLCRSILRVEESLKPLLMYWLWENIAYSSMYMSFWYDYCRLLFVFNLHCHIVIFFLNFFISLDWLIWSNVCYFQFRNLLAHLMMFWDIKLNFFICLCMTYNHDTMASSISFFHFLTD